MVVQKIVKKRKRFVVLPNFFLSWSPRVPFEMEYYFIHIDTSAGFTIPAIGPIFICFFGSMGSYLGNDVKDIGLQMLNCPEFLGIKLLFNSVHLNIVQRCQIADSCRPIHINISANKRAIKHTYTIGHYNPSVTITA